MRACLQCKNPFIRFAKAEYDREEFWCDMCGGTSIFPKKFPLHLFPEIADEFDKKMMSAETNDMKTKCCGAEIKSNWNNKPFCAKCFTNIELEPVSSAATWKKEGKCPECGELGRFSHFSYLCSKHGPYT